MKQFITVEILKCWDKQVDDTMEQVSARFEAEINKQRESGYHLHSWQFSQTFTPTRDGDGLSFLNDTIIAVFQKERR